MNAILGVEQNGALAAPGGYDPFAAYGQEAGGGGDFLKFSKGDWTKGQMEEEVEAGSRFAANMDEFAVGWIRWGDGKPQERRMHALISGVKPEPRDSLGFTDQAEWDRDDQDKPRDPWQFTNELPMADPATGEQLTFSTSSRGGIGAIGNLCKAYGREYRNRPGMTPIVEIGTDKYKHRDSSRGWIKVPVLTLVSWVAPDAIQIRDQDKDQENAEADGPAAAGSKTRF